MKTLCNNKPNTRVNVRIFSLTFLSSKVITVVKLIFVLTEAVLLNVGDYLLTSVNFDCDYLRYRFFVLLNLSILGVLWI